MNEKVVTRGTLQALEIEMPGGVGFKHFDVATDGVPDLTWTWNRRTCWLELKYDRGEVRAAQVVTMRRLAQMGLAFYVSFDYDAKSEAPVTSIWNPRTVVSARVIVGHNYRAVAQFIRSTMERGSGMKVISGSRNLDAKFHAELVVPESAGAGDGEIARLDRMIRDLGARIEVIKTTNGQAVPGEEPICIFRARDQLAIPLLEYYRQLCVIDGCNDHQMGLVDARIHMFREFAAWYKERMKQPGITRGL